MRILHILDHSIPLHSGYTFRTKAILDQQRALGWETLHLTSPKQGAVSVPEEQVDGLTFYRSPPLSPGLSKIPVLNQLAIMAGLRARLTAVVQQTKPDLLHAHSPSLNGLAALAVARRFKLPLVYEVRAFWEDAAVDHGTSTEHGLRYRLTRLSETRVLRGADAITTICNGLREDIIARGIAADKVSVIPNAVDIDKFEFARPPAPALRNQLGLDGKFVLGFLGSFYAYEGLLLLVEAMPQLLAHNPQLRLLLVGGGPQEAALQQQVAALGLGQVVIFTGRVPHAQVQDYYDLVDLLVYPRLSMRLTELVTPLKPLEAMAQGKLLLASDVGGHQELIKEGYNGFMFRAGSAAALVAAVQAIAAQRERWPQIRANGRDYVETERNWRVSVSRYRPIYESLVQRG